MDKSYALIATFLTLIAAWIGYVAYRAYRMNADFNWPASGVYAVSFCALAAIGMLALAIFAWHQAWKVQR